MAFKTKPLRYLGGISGNGFVQHNGENIAAAKFDLDGYFRPNIGVTGCGEIQLSGAALKSLFGRTDLQLLTDRGLILALRFSDTTLDEASEVAAVDVTGEFPTAPEQWRSQAPDPEPIQGLE
jgi:hypothetical protein